MQPQRRVVPPIVIVILLVLLLAVGAHVHPGHAHHILRAVGGAAAAVPAPDPVRGRRAGRVLHGAGQQGPALPAHGTQPRLVALTRDQFE
jgi:hypothetical protein